MLTDHLDTIQTILDIEHDRREITISHFELKKEYGDLDEIGTRHYESCLKERDAINAALLAVRAMQQETQLDWTKAIAHLSLCEREYAAIGDAGRFAMALTIIPLKYRLETGERTHWLYQEIMEIKL